MYSRPGASLITEPRRMCRTAQKGAARTEPRRCQRDTQRGQRPPGDKKTGELKAKVPNTDGEGY